MVLLIDNYDSFVHNLARYVRELGRETSVHRSDAITLSEIIRLGPSHVIVSPGPRTPAEASLSKAVILALGPKTPILGVCLGHQCVAYAFGAEIVRAHRPRHGKTSPIRHEGEGIFAGLPSPFEATRYHSLIVPREGLPECLKVTATTGDDEIMALQHRSWPLFGVQFHPESVLTEHGYALLNNFLASRAA